MINSKNRKQVKRSSRGKKAKHFKFEGSTCRKGPLSVVPVRVERREEQKSLLDACIITVPKSCGTAVKRNKLRRLLKEHLRQNHADMLRQKTIWIRVSRELRLSAKMDKDYWITTVDGLLSGLK